MTLQEKAKRYPSTDLFEVVDAIGVPHAYTIGPRHVVHASDYCGGMLGEDTMRAVQCAHPGCRLPYDRHEHALLVRCKVDDKEKLRAYLLSIKEQAEKDGFVGFTLLRGW